jgi:hypothetical protein
MYNSECAAVEVGLGEACLRWAEEVQGGDDSSVEDWKPVGDKLSESNNRQRHDLENY